MAEVYEKASIHYRSAARKVDKREGGQMSQVRRKHMRGSWLFFLAMLLLLVLLPLYGTNQPMPAMPKEVRPDEAIPQEDYKSWSLFLICNPMWLLHENQERVRMLYERFKAFGEAIGPSHLAVWFWKGTPGTENPALPASVDADRSSQYCQRFGLLPSESPHVLVTTRYPDLATSPGDHKGQVTLKLYGTDADDITILLAKLADQLVVEGLQQTAIDSEAYWRAWERSVEKVLALLAEISKHVEVSLDTWIVKVKLGGGAN
jgi:hypothetical protein